MTLNSRLRSFKVIENCTIRKFGCDFLFAFHCNFLSRMFSCFDTIHERDGRTPHNGIDRAYACRRATKTRKRRFRPIRPARQRSSRELCSISSSHQSWGGDWAGCGPAQSPPRCTKCNSPPINRQCTNFILFDVAHNRLCTVKGWQIPSNEYVRVGRVWRQPDRRGADLPDVPRRARNACWSRRQHWCPAVKAFSARPRNAYFRQTNVEHGLNRTGSTRIGGVAATPSGQQRHWCPTATARSS